MRRWFWLVVLLLPGVAHAYPTDREAQERTGIRRLSWQQKVDAGEVQGRKSPVGAQWPSAHIELRLTENPGFELNAETPKDPELQSELEAILQSGRYRNYRIAVVDLSDPTAPKLAAMNETVQQTPASVAKVLVAAALLNEISARHPDDIAARELFLREHHIVADDWAMPNGHQVPVVQGQDANQVAIRRVRTGDSFSLWEWLDHALSPSSNAAASMVWREATLMRLLGEDYPPTAYGPELYTRWDRETWTQAAFETVRAPVVAAGLDPESFSLRMFFTKGANRYIAAESSRASPLGVAAWMVKVEQGRMVNAWASEELKRLLYLTRRRVRYLATAALEPHAAYFKSGSLYQCKPEAGFTCIQYQGNVVNVLNALVEIETAPDPAEAPSVSPPDPRATEASPETADVPQPSAAPSESDVPASPKAAEEVEPPTPEHVYIVVVMSNVLKRNAALDHARLAELIHAATTKAK